MSEEILSNFKDLERAINTISDNHFEELDDYKDSKQPVKISLELNLKRDDNWIEMMDASTFQEFILISLDNRISNKENFQELIKPFLHERTIPEYILVKKKKYIQFWLVVKSFAPLMRVRHSFEVQPDSLLEQHSSRVLKELIYKNCFCAFIDRHAYLYFDCDYNDFLCDFENKVLFEKLNKFRKRNTHDDYINFRIPLDDLCHTFHIFQTLNFLVYY